MLHKSRQFFGFLQPNSFKKGDTIVLMKSITKRFPGVIANYKIDFDLKYGEVHALLGENGAGKTTLVSILYGIHKPDEGEIYVYGRKVRFKSPRDAIRLGIGMVHQHPRLVDSLTVAENIALGLKGVSLLRPLNEIEDLIREYSEKYHLKVDPRAKVWQLTAGEKQRVAILRVLISGAKILILDEPTTSLSPLEREELFNAIKVLVNEGTSIIFISHKLKEVLEISDRITVLRKGRKIGTLPASEATPEILVKMMLGEDRASGIRNFDMVPSKLSLAAQRREEKTILEVENLYVIGDRGELAVNGVSFKVNSGEIFGIAGVPGNGQRELVEAIVGLRKVKHGMIKINGINVTNKRADFISDLGVAYIPEDRIRYGLVLDLSVAENLILKDYRKRPFSGRLMLNTSYILKWCERLVRQYDIKTPNLATPVRHLSGGNLQRVIVARELSRSPKLIVAFHPTFGLDIAATEYVQKILIQEKKRGAAILLISEDLDEIMQLSDRIAVMFEGKFLDIIPVEKADVRRIGLLMLGIKNE